MKLVNIYVIGLSKGEGKTNNSGIRGKQNLLVSVVKYYKERTLVLKLASLISKCNKY